MECFWIPRLLSSGADLPTELSKSLSQGSDAECLASLTKAALNPKYTTTLLVYCREVFPHVCACLRQHGSLAQAIATLGRVIPFAPFLSPYAQDLLQTAPSDFLVNLDEEDALQSALGILRLLQSDRSQFQQYIDLRAVSSLLTRSTRSLRYIAVRILQVCLDGADDWFEKAFTRYLGPDSPDSHIDGAWEGRVIDYRFLSLWEDDRRTAFDKLVASTESSLPANAINVRIISENSRHASTALVGNVLLPRKISDGPAFSTATPLIATRATNANLRSIANALTSNRPLLLCGEAGSGKSSLVRYVARRLGKLESMVTLHLNEQSDAKLLLGVYTTGETPGSFTWKPGVLTTAVQEGRWLVLEDLDRCPNEIIGVLLPLIESRELYIANRKQNISAAQGFRVVATVRNTVNHRGESLHPLAHMVGLRHWNVVQIEQSSLSDIQRIAEANFSSLTALLPQYIRTYGRLREQRQRAVLVGRSKTGMLRSISQRDLFKWCRRTSQLLTSKDEFTSHDLDDIFMEAVDCLVGALPDDDARASITSVIAEELQIDPQRRDFLLSDRAVPFRVEKGVVNVGRYCCSRTVTNKPGSRSPETFSVNPYTSRMLERVMAAVVNAEPLLLVGETGVGKTSSVQYLATLLGKKLIPFNLSQQSEAGDLLGGFKPVTMRSIVIPLKDEFDDLFRASFSSGKNQQFLNLLNKQTAKSNWTSVCKLWRQALAMVDQRREQDSQRENGGPNKKRKVEADMRVDFMKWDDFRSKLSELESRIQAGTDAFAFTFVEGNIVKAVRNGDWILLDEINLAPADTLEAVTDLLDHEYPSLLLTEAGSAERITAHPDFRVFAAMNPATDAGKRDLPLGIRSRFTELYVESPDRDFLSLQSIVHSYLRSETFVDVSLSRDVSELYRKIVTAAQNNQLIDGAGQAPHFSLRTLTRTLTYARSIEAQCGIRRALYEGFQMSFMTFLDQESAAVVEPLLQMHLFEKKTNLRVEFNRSLKTPQDGFEYVQGWPGSKHWIRKGSNATQEQGHYILTPFVQRNLENLVRAASTRKFPVLIQGPTSSGKTSMIEYLAKRTGHPFVRINNHEHTDLQEYLGTYVSGADGRLKFEEGLLVKALRQGHWIVLDELNLAPTDVLEALNRLLDDNRELLIPETQEVIRPHESFMLFATQNPAGLYGGRKTLSRAFRNRFLELHFDDIPIDELEEILHRRTQLPQSRCKRIVTVYKELSILRQGSRIFEQKSFATLRDLFRWASRPNDTIQDLATNGFMLLGERVRDDEERQELRKIIERVMSKSGPRVNIEEDMLYATTAPEIQRYHANQTVQSTVWTKAMRRLYILVSRAIANNEPVLLVGETGCGKTTVCQMLAEASGKKLHTLNAHQNTETGDLIGSQRPVRNRSAIEAELRTLLTSSSLLEGFEDLSRQTTELLVQQYETRFAQLRTKDQPDDSLLEERQVIYEAQTRSKALFEWSDGGLVQAMKTGNFFLLDEISLADDSVLERLNSVLESGRSILLAEKGSLDSSVTADPQFQFLATMNPGGDYGKRELSPALRNRFTEIWVPPLTDTQDFLQIVRASLDERLKMYAEQIVSFASWFRQTYNTSSSKAVSIRETLAWVAFSNTCRVADDRIAIIHGAAMVHIDSLGANPAGLTSLLGRDVRRERQVCLEKIGELMTFDIGSLLSASSSISITQTAFSIGPFSIPCSRTTKLEDTGFTFDTITSRLNAMRILRAMQLPKPIMLEGSPGVGKTAIVTAIAKVVGMPLTRINLSDQTDLIDLFGSDAPVDGASVGTFEWRDAPFLRAMKAGEWVLLDEMNLASQSVLEGLNACLDHRGEVYVPELGQTFSKHPQFRLFAAQNPHHQGGGRKGLPASFVNRFTVVYADSFQANDLVTICQRSFPEIETDIIEQVVKFVRALEDEVVQQRSFGSAGGPWEFNLRDVSRWFSLQSSGLGFTRSATFIDLVDLLFTQRFRTSQDRVHLAEILVRYSQQPETLQDLTRTVSTEHIQIGLAVLSRDHLYARGAIKPGAKAWTGESLRLLQSVMICVQARWPVILTGPTGSGKSFLIQRLASFVGARLQTFAMNAETDAMDLIGGYEQSDMTRQRHEQQDALREKLYEEVKKLLLREDRLEAETCKLLLSLEQKHDNLDLTGLYRACEGTLSPESRAALKRLAELSQSVAKGQFEWVDGVLVDSLTRGDWLVLDNANLCSASVLDRLNSLLETDGALIINEHSESDGSPRILRPHPNFRIFLTVDPRYGELSRAMRNRAVELYLMPSQQDCVSIDPLDSESTMSNLHLVRTVKQAQKESIQMKPLLTIAQGHTTLRDLPLMHRYWNQVETGLFGGLDSEIPDELAHAATDEQGFATLTRSLYSHVLEMSPDHSSFMSAMPLYPLNNSTVLSQDLDARQRAISLAFGIDIMRNKAVLDEAFETITGNKHITRKITNVERNLVKSSSGSQSSAELRRSVFDGLKSLLPTLLQELDGIKQDEISHLKTMSNRLYGLLQIYTALVQESNFDSSALDSWITVAHRIIDRVRPNAIASISTVSQRLYDIIKPLVEARSSSRRDVYTALWQNLRPATVKRAAQLQGLILFESMLEGFDTTCQAFEDSIETLAKTRISFAQVLTLLVAGTDDALTLAKSITELHPRGADSLRSYQHDRQIYFKDVFEGLCQHMAVLALDDFKLDTRSMSILEILAGRPTSMSVIPRYKEQEKALSAELKHLGSLFTGNFAPLPARALQLLNSTHNIALSNFDLLHTELKVLASILAGQAHHLGTDHLLGLNQGLKRILTTLLDILVSLSDASVSGAARLLQSQLEATSYASPSKQAPGSTSSDTSSLSSEIMPFEYVVQYLQTTYQEPDSALRAASRAWFTLGMICMKLYIPTQLFDPNFEQQLFRRSHDVSVAKLADQHRAVRAFQSALYGTQDCWHANELSEEVANLGSSPIVEEIYRPPNSEIAQLQGEFVALNHVRNQLEEHIRDGSVNLLLSESVWANMEQIRHRLTTQYRAYADITHPIIGFIDCLKVAQRLQQYGGRSNQGASVGQIVPFARANKEAWLHETTFVSLLSDCQHDQEILLVLQALSCRTSVAKNRTMFSGVAKAVNAKFVGFYERWKDALDVEQRRTAARSSLYKFKGDDHLEQEKEVEALDELFAEDRSADQLMPATSAPSSDIQRLSTAIADVHRALFVPEDVTTEHLENLCLSFGNVPNSSGRITHDLVATLLLTTRQQMNKFTDSNKKSIAFDMYSDADTGEAERLSKLVLAILKRFQELHQRWSEHATPIDVSRLCEQIVGCSHSSPLPTFFPLIEKLHGMIAGWEKIASREFSASEVYERLTTLIIDWRQMELRSWSSLFDREMRNCEKMAKSWWFVAFETIIVATLSQNNLMELQQYVQGLMKTLALFVSQCGLGEFQARLRILRGFESQLDMLLQDNPDVTVVHHALHNFLNFHERFIPPVLEALVKGRADLNKDMSSIIQVASWRDRNVESLRQSAKSSHMKLVRLVRKFRTLLAQPVTSIYEQGIPRNAVIESQQLIVYEPRAPKAFVVSPHVRTLGVNKSWDRRPERYRDITSTVHLMQQMCEQVTDSHFAGDQVEKFREDVKVTIKELQDATPGVLTAENKKTVQHLKTRKRRLLADVLKELRMMGLQANLSADVLAEQDGSHVVLTKLSKIGGPSPDLDVADYYLHRLMELMPTVRTNARQASDDLTSAEVARCLALLESQLQIAVQQRNAVAQSWAQISSLQGLVNLIDALSTSTDLQPSNQDKHASNDQINFVAIILKATASLVKMQEELAGHDYREIKLELDQLVNEILRLQSAAAKLNALPIGIANPDELAFSATSRAHYENIRLFVGRAVDQNPELQPLLSHILIWLPNDSENVQTQSSKKRIHFALQNWTDEFLSTADQILASLQTCVDVSTMRSKTDADKCWLTHQQKFNEREIMSLRIDTVVERLALSIKDLNRATRKDLRSLSLMCRELSPVISAYNDMASQLVMNQCQLMARTNRLSFELASSFSTLAQKGFCTPGEKSDQDEQQSGKMESGTGLGDGEGAEDISKDVGDDEDLSELAQQKREDGEKDDIEESKDAVDMADEEFEGETADDNASADEDKEDKGDGDEENEEMDEEAGEVDDLGQSTIDEKMWDGAKDENQKDAKGDKSNGKQKEEDLAAAEGEVDGDNEPGGDDENEEMGAPADEREEINGTQPENIDQHTKEEETLALPDDLNVDGGDAEEHDGSDLASILDEGDDEGKLDDFKDSIEDENVDEQGAENAEEGQTNLDDDQDQMSTNEGQAEEDTRLEEGLDDENTLMQDDSVDHGQEEQLDDEMFGESGDGQEDQQERVNKASAQQNGLAEHESEEEGRAEDDMQQPGADGGQSKVQGDDQDVGQDSHDDNAKSAYQRIGDALDEWYRQNRKIEAAPEDAQKEPGQESRDIDMAEATFEHVQDDDDEGDTQALGAASVEQSTAIDETKGLAVHEQDEHVAPPKDNDTEMSDAKDETEVLQQDQQNLSDAVPQDEQIKTVIGDSSRVQLDRDMLDDASQTGGSDREDDLETVDEQLHRTHLAESAIAETIPADEARRLWSEHESRTRNLAVVLTEHLRLILHPTQATKMRGDFRTGKRLNIKRIIPYIASSYKRDKIWMRRSVPSKRTYQIMLAIDDSLSMSESQSRSLAFDTVALVAKSLAMLEVGELCVVGFGETVNVAHEFETPFTAEAGPEIFRRFTFSQNKTNVRRLMRESTTLFQNARLKAVGAASELWQLQLVISDGVCEDHEKIRQLVLQAQEERIMVVFIIVDATLQAPDASASSSTTRAGTNGVVRQQSILDLQTAEFVKDAAGEMQLKMVKYLDTFPFRYYLIVRDVQELPGVLSGALRQWFSEVVETAS